jgi:predicted Zn-dependent protease
MPAIATLSKLVSQDQNTGQQQTIIVLSYFIDDNGKYYVFHGVSSEGDFLNFISSFETTMTQFARLTDPSKINVKPERVMVRSVKRTTTLTEVFRDFGIQQQRMNEMALLNNLELTDRIEAGRLIKIVGK